jgi:hypothetical protein
MLAAYFMLVYFLAYSSILQMEATCLSETSTDFCPVTWLHIQEDRTLYEARAISFKSFNICIHIYSEATNELTAWRRAFE